ncbi:MAG TPA: hypothetical protein VNE39_20165 [Planctomycetota bacterium]|nr:hypothetical protein [Planctomycetota bacterium]
MRFQKSNRCVTCMAPMLILQTAVALWYVFGTRCLARASELRVKQTVVATYRGAPVEALLPEDTVPFIIHPLMTSEERRIALAQKWQASYGSFQGAVRMAILEYWATRFALKLDGDKVQAEKRAASAESFPEIFDGAKIRADRIRKNLEELGSTQIEPGDGIPLDVCLLGFYLKDPKAAESLHDQYFKNVVPPQDWARLKRDYRTREAFRSYAADRIAATIEEDLLASARCKVIEKQLIDELVRRKTIVKPEDFAHWLQAELEHVKVLRGDVLPMFVEDSPLPKADLPLRLEK